jgi:phosphatidylinositol alpha-1,6-mannosyltransferase
MMRAVPRLFLGMESLTAANSGIGRLAWLLARAVAEEVRAGEVAARGLALNDEAPPPAFPLPVAAAAGSRLRFVTGVTRAHWTHTHFLYDFLGMARAHGWLPLPRRPYLVMVCGVEAWPGPWARADRVRVARRATMLVAISAHTRTRATELDPTFARAKVCWLATLEDAVSTLPPVQTGRPQVLILARMDEMGYKGHRELIECWPRVVAAVPDATLTIGGGGPRAEEYRRLAADSPAASRIEFTGLVPQERLEELWAQTTVFAMPSRGEGFGLVYIEAMRYGIPVIASIHDAGQEINLDGQTGYNVNLDRPEELPERLIHLLKSPDQAATLGANGRKRWAEHFRYSAFRDRFRPLLQEFLEL